MHSCHQRKERKMDGMGGKRERKRSKQRKETARETGNTPQDVSIARCGEGGGAIRTFQVNPHKQRDWTGNETILPTPAYAPRDLVNLTLIAYCVWSPTGTLTPVPLCVPGQASGRNGYERGSKRLIKHTSPSSSASLCGLGWYRQDG